MKGLNLSGWEKVGEDKKSTVLKHKNGHTMTLAHSKLPKIQCEALKRLKFAEGGDVEKAPPPVTVNVGSAPSMPSPQQAPAPVPVNVPQVPPTPNVLGSGNSVNPGATAQTAQTGLKLGSQIEAAKAAALVPQLQQSLNQQSNLNQYDTDTINALTSHAEDLNSYQKQKPIRPNAYLEDMGSGKKMATGLSLLLSGAGSGLSGQPNIAYDFLNKQIDRNVKSQMDNFNQRHTVFGAYKDLYGDQQVASNMARIHQLDFLKTQAEQTAAQLGTPTAAANLMKLQSEIAPERQKLLMDSAGRLQSLPNYQGSPSKESNESVPDQGAHKPNTNQKLIDQGIVAGERSNGPPVAQASIPKDQQSMESENNTILAPNAQSKLDNLQFGNPQARRDYPEALQQYTKSQQVEKQIKQINDLFPKLRGEATLSGNIGSHINPHAFGATGAGLGAIVGGGGLGALTGGTLAIPGAAGGATAGGVLGEGVAHGLRGMADVAGGQKEVQYQTDKAGLAKFLIGALGGQATGSEIDDIVNTNTPGYWDNEKTYKKKLDNIKKFLINRTETSLLDRYGLSTK